MTIKLEASWKEALAEEFQKPYWQELAAFVKAEYAEHPCFPAPKYIFRALDMVPLPDVKVVIL